MPVEIRELVIRATVVDDNTHEDSPNENRQTEPSQDFIQECVDRVLAILKHTGER